MLNLQSFERQKIVTKTPQISEDPSSCSQKEVDSIMKELGLTTKAYKRHIILRKEKIAKAQDNSLKMYYRGQKKWFKKQGKNQLFKFTEEEQKELKKYFDNLDDDGGGSIGIEELETPLISLGIAQSREDVQEIIDKVDEDGDILFEEFLDILSQSEAKDNDRGLVKFFKDLSNGQIEGLEGNISNDLSFNNIISTVRRQRLLGVFYAKDKRKKQQSLDILMSFERLRKLQMKEEEAKALFKEQEDLRKATKGETNTELKQAVDELDDFLLAGSQEDDSDEDY